MTKQRDTRRILIGRLLGGAAVGASVFAATREEAEAANILFENTLFLAGNSDGVTKRTLTQRTTEIFNVMDYGAKGDFSTDDTAAIQAAINASYASARKSAIVFFPPGTYKVTSAIDIGNHNGGSNFTSGIIRGSGRFATSIFGNLPNDFILFQDDGINGPEEISNLTINNTSTVIGTGALRFSNSSMRITNCNFGGQINVYMPYNVFQASIDNCTGGCNSDPTTGYTGTIGIAGFCPNIEGWRGSTPAHTAMQLYGTNTCKIAGSSHENLTIGMLLGFATGWASQCTVSGNVLTVGGTLGNGIGATKNFQVGAEIFMKGLTTTADWGISPYDASICTITEDNSNNPSRTGTGYAGTYTISRSATIASPVPCVSRFPLNLSGLTVESFATEAAAFIMVMTTLSSCTFLSCGGSATTSECIDAFGNTGFAANTGFYIRGGCGTVTFISCASNNNPTNAGWYFDPGGSENSNFVLENCTSQKLADPVTGTSSSISNGSGGAGTLLDVVSFTGSGPNPNMKVTGAGVTGGTVITGNYLTETAAISSYTYNSGTGLVTLTLAAPVTLPSNYKISTRNLNIAGANVNNTAIAASVSASATVTYTAATGLVGSPSGGGTLHLLTGSSSVGTYRVNNSQLVTGTVLTIKTGDDWIIPTLGSAKTGVNLIGCNSANLPAGYVSGLANGMARTYASLPGNSGSNGNYPVQDGMVYDIVDGLAGQCADGTCTTFGTNVNGGGGALHLQVRYNASAAKWRLVGI